MVRVVTTMTAASTRTLTPNTQSKRKREREREQRRLRVSELVVGAQLRYTTGVCSPAPRAFYPSPSLPPSPATYGVWCVCDDDGEDSNNKEMIPYDTTSLHK